MKINVSMLVITALLISSTALAKSESTPILSSKLMPSSAGNSLSEAANAIKKEIDAKCAVDKVTVSKVLQEAVKDVKSFYSEKLKEAVKDRSKDSDKDEDKKRDNRGDPKTDLEQKKNQEHRNTDRSKDAPVLQKPVDLKKYQVAGELEVVGNLRTVIYTPTGNNLYYDLVTVTYDVTTGKMVEAKGLKTVTVTTEPDLTGMTLVLQSNLADGTTVKKYGLYTTPQMSVNDVSKWILGYYQTSSQSFLYARVQTVDTLDLKKLKL